MWPLIHLALAALPQAASASPPTAPASFSCKYEAAGGDIIGEATIELRDGQITKVRFSDLFAPSQPGGLGYSCLIETTPEDEMTKWRDVKGAIEVELPNAADWGDGSSMLVRTTAKGFTLDF